MKIFSSAISTLCVWLFLLSFLWIFTPLGRFGSDVGIKAIKASNSTVGVGTPIGIEFENAGIFKNANYSFSIHIYINGFLWKTATGLVEPKPGKSYTVTPANLWKASSPGRYEIKAILASAGDRNKHNNEATKIVLVE